MAVVGALHVSFVCTGNICRSPMAEKMFAVHLSREGLADHVRVSSAGTDGWHAGQDADARTNATLRRHGYPTGHVAAKLGNDHRAADLLVALDSGHERRLATLGIPGDRRRLLRSFDPGADTRDVPDPYYGDTTDFELVHDQIAAAIPGLLAWVRTTLDARGDDADPTGDAQPALDASDPDVASSRAAGDIGDASPSRAACGATDTARTGNAERRGASLDPDTTTSQAVTHTSDPSDTAQPGNATLTRNPNSGGGPDHDRNADAELDSGGPGTTARFTDPVPDGHR